MALYITSADRIGPAIKYLRRRRGLSQQELGDRAGLVKAHVLKIEKGYIFPRIHTLIALADALGMDLAFAPRTSERKP